MRLTTTPRLAPLRCGLLACLLTLAAGCDSGPGASIYDPDISGAPDPVITSVEPGGSALAGIDIVTITGQNFSSVLEENLVYFDEERAEVIEASPTQLRVLPPNIPRPEITLRVAVLGAENFSTAMYRLDAAAERFAELPVSDEPFALAIDDAGNVYVSLFAEDVSIGIKRYSPDGERSDYLPPISAPWRDLTLGPDGTLYGVRRVGAVFALPEGGPPQVWGIGPAQNEPFGTLAFDADGSLWVGSRNGDLFRFAPDGSSFERFELDGIVEDIALFNGHLYAAVTQQMTGAPTVSKVVRFPLTEGGGLGPAEDYAAISADFGVNALALAFAADGSLLVGTSASADASNRTSLILVAPDGSADVFYPGIVAPPVSALAWGTDTKVYAIGRVAGDGESNGRGLPDLIQIETRRTGA